MRIALRPLALLPLLLAPLPAHATTWAIDKAHTEVRFTWDHLGMSRQGGRFTDVTGTVTFDSDSPEASTIDITIPLKSISTGVAKLDEHLVRTKDFFDAEAHPAIAFKSTSVRQKSDRTFDVDGVLSINGVTNPVTLDVIWNFTGDHPLANINPTFAGFYSSGFSATTQIRRSDWGIKRTIPYISDEIRITIETEMHRTGPPPPAAAATSAIEQATGEPGDTILNSSGDGPRE
jgi:polyisoprenoid-binding protein YceI